MWQWWDEHWCSVLSLKLTKRFNYAAVMTICDLRFLGCVMCICIELVCFLIAAILPRSNGPLSFSQMALLQLTWLVPFGMEAGDTLHRECTPPYCSLGYWQVHRLCRCECSWLRLTGRTDEGNVVCLHRRRDCPFFPLWEPIKFSLKSKSHSRMYFK